MSNIIEDGESDWLYLGDKGSQTQPAGWMVSQYHKNTVYLRRRYLYLQGRFRTFY